jgi:hypothetical protein
MFRLREILRESDAAKANRKDDFQFNEQVGCPPIYSFLYLRNATISEGKLIGTWTPPGAGSTNSVLLWPQALRYFFSCIRETTPEIFKSDVLD